MALLLNRKGIFKLATGPLQTIQDVETTIQGWCCYIEENGGFYPIR